MGRCCNGTFLRFVRFGFVLVAKKLIIINLCDLKIVFLGFSFRNFEIAQYLVVYLQVQHERKFVLQIV